jgi:hypothetical protein
MAQRVESLVIAFAARIAIFVLLQGRSRLYRAANEREKDGDGHTTMINDTS